MTDDDPFADLGETLAGGADENGDESSEATTEDADEPVEAREPMTDPAFAYEAATQRPFYARDVTIEDFDSWLKYELERELSERGYRNIVVREMTDALLRTVVEEDLIAEVSERFEAARESAGPQSDEE